MCIRDRAKADQITEKLADMLDFNLPEAVVEREVYGILQQLSLIHI